MSEEGLVDGSRGLLHSLVDRIPENRCEELVGVVNLFLKASDLSTKGNEEEESVVSILEKKKNFYHTKLRQSLYLGGVIIRKKRRLEEEVDKFKAENNELRKKLFSTASEMERKHDEEIKELKRSFEEEKRRRILSTLEHSLKFKALKDRQAPGTPKSIKSTEGQNQVKGEIELEERESQPQAAPAPPPPLTGIGPPAPPPMGAPPPPPNSPSSPGDEDDTRIRQSSLPLSRTKSKETIGIKVGIIPRRKLQKSIFQKDRLLEKGQMRFFKTDTVRNILQEKFQVKRKKSGPDGLLRGGNAGNLSNVPRKRIRKRAMSNTVVPLVNSQKSLNGSIVCSRINDKEKVLKCINISDEWCYKSSEGQEMMGRIDQIYRMFSPQELKIIAGKARTLPEEFIKEKLSPADQFILRLFRLPNLETKLQIFEFLMTHEDIFSNLKTELSKYLSFCDNLKDSEQFRNFLSLVLGITNFLNQDATKNTPDSPRSRKIAEEEEEESGGHKKKKKSARPVFGISIRSLLNLVRVKNPHNSKENLLDVVYGIILKKDPDMLKFRENFSLHEEIVKQPPISEKMDSFKTLQGRVNLLRRHLHAFEKDRKGMDKNDCIISTLEKCVPELEREISDIESTFKVMDDRVGTISELFGHSKDTIHEFFSVLHEFLDLVDQTEKKFFDTEKKNKRLEKRQARKLERLAKKAERLRKKEERMKRKKEELLEEEEHQEHEEEGEEEEEEEEEEVEGEVKVPMTAGTQEKGKQWESLLEHVNKETASKID